MTMQSTFQSTLRLMLQHWYPSCCPLVPCFASAQLQLSLAQTPGQGVGQDSVRVSQHYNQVHQAHTVTPHSTTEQMGQSSAHGRSLTEPHAKRSPRQQQRQQCSSLNTTRRQAGLPIQPPQATPAHYCLSTCQRTCLFCPASRRNASRTGGSTSHARPHSVGQQQYPFCLLCMRPPQH